MKLKPFLIIILSALFGLVVHEIISHLFSSLSFGDKFVYSIPILYATFCFFSVIIIGMMLKVKKINIDYVGYTFLLLTSLKMVVAYLMMQPIFHHSYSITPTDKMNFFIIFIYFLVIETFLTVRILNNKQ